MILRYIRRNEPESDVRSSGEIGSPSESGTLDIVADEGDSGCWSSVKALMHGK